MKKPLRKISTTPVLAAVFAIMEVLLLFPSVGQPAGESQAYPLPGPTLTPRVVVQDEPPSYFVYLPLIMRKWAVFDLTLVETSYTATNGNHYYGIPGNTNATLGAWIQARTGVPNLDIFIGILDTNTGQYIASTSQFVTIPQALLWTPQWTFKTTPDSYEVYAFYWNGTEWVTADTAIGWLQADDDYSSDGHFMWSPNEYTIPFRSTSSVYPGDPNFVDYTQYFWYFDNAIYGATNGSNRLAYMKTLTGNPGGKFQVEFRRDREGWDAMYEECYDTGCLYFLYGYSTNIPGGYADGTTTEENHLGGDEEAEVSTQESESMMALTLDDPTNVYSDKGYFVTFTFYRRPEQQGQPVVLTTEFEVIEAYWDFSFDVVQTTYRNEEF